MRRAYESDRGRRFTALFEVLVRTSAATTVGVAALTACGSDASGTDDGALGRSDAAAVPDGEVQDGARDSAVGDATFGDAGVEGDATTDAATLDSGVDVDASVAALRTPLTLDACDIVTFAVDGGADASALSIPADAGTASLPQFLAHATVSSPVEYLDARMLDRNTTAGDLMVLGSAGNACAGVDAAACAATLHALTYPFGESPLGRVEVPLLALGYVRGGAPGLVAAPGNFPEGGTPRIDPLTFLGPIRTIPSAALIGYLGGHTVQCGPKTASVDADGVRLITKFGEFCSGGDGVFEARVLVKGDGALAVEDKVLVTPPEPHCAIGRRPEGMMLGGAPGGCHPAGEYLAEAAGLEEASIAAFDRLVRELEAHGAPKGLVTRARRARADEVRHTRTMQKLARRYGATPRRPVSGVLPVRSLEAMALENVAEGCVRETFGALSATWSARHALDPEVRRAMAVVAQDETEHAALAWDVASWVSAKLDADARQRVEDARADAENTLRHELERPLDAEVVRVLGLPGAREAVALFDSLVEGVQAA